MGDCDRRLGRCSAVADGIRGGFLSLIADAAAQAFAHRCSLLALLKHPLAVLGFETAVEARALAVELEEKALRGPRPVSGNRGFKREAVDPKVEDRRKTR